MKRFAVIVAGGTGTRMKSDVPKQFLEINGVPIIIQTVRRFLATDHSIEVIVVLPEKHLAYWDALKNAFPFIQDIKTVAGGSTRGESVRAGLNKIGEDGLVAIHDAVRPYVETATILASYVSAREKGSGVAVVPLKDSLREVLADNQSIAHDRSNFVLVQTPQTFRIRDIKEAYDKLGNQVFTDDATVFEKAGHPVSLVEGSYANIKITTPEDLS